MKLGLAAAAGVIAVGALVLRHMKRIERGSESRSPLSDEELSALEVPAWDATYKRGDPERPRLTNNPDIPLP